MHYAEVSKEYETKNLGKLEVKFTVPQGDDLAELVGPNFFRSEAELAERTNKVIARGALQNGNVLLKDVAEKATTSAEWDEAVKKAVAAAKGYKPEVTTGVSQKAAKQGVDNLQDFRTKHADLFKTLNADEVFAFLTENTLPERIVAQLAARESAPATAAA